MYWQEFQKHEQDLINKYLNLDTEISKLQEPFPVNQKILGLQISMQDFVPMAFLNTVQELVQVFLQ